MYQSYQEAMNSTNAAIQRPPALQTPSYKTSASSHLRQSSQFQTYLGLQCPHHPPRNRYSRTLSFQHQWSILSTNTLVTANGRAVQLSTSQTRLADTLAIAVRVRVVCWPSVRAPRWCLPGNTREGLDAEGCDNPSSTCLAGAVQST